MATIKDIRGRIYSKERGEGAGHLNDYRRRLSLTYSGERGGDWSKGDTKDGPSYESNKRQQEGGRCFGKLV